MRLNHANLRVRDAAACRDFYVEHFGFGVEFEAEDGYFLRAPDGFLLAVVPAEPHAPLPDGFHLGFTVVTADVVTATRERLAGGDVTVGPLEDLRPDEDYVSFRCWDPDGTELEVYWDG